MNLQKDWETFGIPGVNKITSETQWYKTWYPNSNEASFVCMEEFSLLSELEFHWTLQEANVIRAIAACFMLVSD